MVNDSEEDHSLLTTDALRAEHLRSPFYGLAPVPFSQVTASGVRPYLIARKRELQQEILSVNALLNADVPINRIPLELLGEIFLCVQSVFALPGTWFTILTVCRHWFIVAATTPRLWCDLYARDKLDLLKTGLLRSKSCPVSVFVYYPNHVPAVADLIIPHAHHIGDLTIWVSYREDGPRLASLMHRYPMPMLKLFFARVAKTIFDPSEEVIEFLPERFPRLRTLHLDGIYTPPSSRIFGQLTTLELSGWLGIIPMLTFDDLSRIIRSCINLEQLSIKDLLVRVDRPASHIAPHDRVTLANLRTLQIDTQTEVIRHILNVIVIPPTACVVINRQIHSDTPEIELLQGIRAVLPNDRTSLPILSRINFVDVRALVDVHVLVGRVGLPLGPNQFPSDEAITLNMEMLEEAQNVVRVGLEDFLDIFRSSPLEELRISTSDSATLHDVDWHQLFASFPKLHTFSIMCQDDSDYLPLIFMGLDPYSAPHQTSEEERLVCPNLRDVSFCNLPGSRFRLSPTAEAQLPECLLRRQALLGSDPALKKLTFTFEGRVSADDLERLQELLPRYVESFHVCEEVEDTLSD
ncbi:hypothetical protein C8Q74DRAFT_873436 [Fomes fomentarius]|nr:hypothetical protein C8Q74DRAFT_873436 [Fomes fomentarius]